MMVKEQAAGDRGESGGQRPASVRLQILATEHWSLLATRALTYSDSFSRVGMFLTVLTGSVVALALLAQVSHLSGRFIVAALLILSVVFFIGLTTIGRLAALNREDVRWVAGMNRLRRAYLEMDPGLEPYFLTDSHDDMRGVFLTMGLAVLPGRPTVGGVAHGFTTLPAVMGVVVSVVAGVLGSLVAAAAGAPEAVVIAVGAVVFLATLAVISVITQRVFWTFAATLQARFPSTPYASRSSLA